ncbi:hypothetical protein DZB84_13720 [Bacillus sp. HNG]|uniref:TniQ family protein n=1 Tax=Bacillus sp. HNG TaxID=2293325 RepID=UPI000E2FE682|nr:TniQ family protein [Bacillus sp. HNG]RFB14964.1 hypothetical protein DZB84_13720 [Bacillus sp. HNG]
MNTVLLERSRLYNLEPVGIGTAEVESLTSYFSRLANCHSVKLSKLLDLEVSKELIKEYLSNSIKRNRTKYTQYINGTSEVSIDFVQALEKLTTRNDLINLTCQNWRGISGHSILNNKRVWCSQCLYEAKIFGYETYEKLIWQIKMINICPEHRTKLESKCPHCNRENAVMSAKLRPGFCSKCEKWLGDNVFSPTKIDEWEKWKINNIKLLLEYFQNSSIVPLNNIIPKFMERLINIFTGGNVRAFAREVGVSRNTLRDFVNGKPSYISLERLLKILYYFEITILEMIELKEIKITKVNKHANSLFQKQNIKRDVNPGEIREKLSMIISLNEIPPPSVKQVMKRLNYSSSTLYKYASDLCKVLAENRANYLNQKKIERLKMIDLEVSRVVKEITAEGKYPSEERVKKRLLFPVYYEELYQAMEKVYKELSIPQK